MEEQNYSQLTLSYGFLYLVPFSEKQATRGWSSKFWTGWTWSHQNGKKTKSLIIQWQSVISQFSGDHSIIRSTL